MTDDNSWVSPDASNRDGATPDAAPPFGSQPVPPPSQPFGAPPPPAPFGQPYGQSYGQPFGGAPTGHTPPAAAAWAPPPKPGLIPLAPMTLGTILGASFRTLRRNPRPLFLVSLIIHGVLAVVTIFVTSLALTTLTTTLNQEISGSLPSQTQLGDLFGADLNTFAASALTLVGTTILLGIVSLDVARGALGERLRLGGLWRRARGRVLVLIGWALALVGVILGLGLVFIALFALVLVGVASSDSRGGAGAIIGGVLLGLLLLLIGLALVLWLGVRTSLVPSILVIERLTLGKAIRRSWSLTRRYFWRTFGIEALVWLIISVASSIVTGPVGVILLIVTGISHPGGIDSASLTSTTHLVTVVSAIVGAIVATVTSIVSTSSTALIYIDLRIRKEGLDLQLMRFVDARQAGATDLPDPYLVAVEPAGPAFPSAAPPSATPV